MDRQLWIDLLDPDLAALTAVLPEGVHRTAMERLLAPPRHDDEPRPRLETHGDYVFGVLVVPSPSPIDTDVVYQEVDVIVGRDRIVTVRKTPPDGAPLDCDYIRRVAVAKAMSPGMCLYHLVDEVAERYLTLVDDLNGDIDVVEDAVEDWPPDKLRSTISLMRHEILHVRRVLTPTRDLARAVLDDRVELDHGDLFPRDVELHFADAYDKLLRAADGLDLSRDLVAGVRDYHQAQVANDQNEVMKRLTVVASVLLLPTFIVGLYGQNLRGVPEFGFRYGYAWSWAVIVLTTVAQLVYFRRKHWI
jgi:magnesium transporter